MDTLGGKNRVQHARRKARRAGMGTWEETTTTWNGICINGIPHGHVPAMIGHGDLDRERGDAQHRDTPQHQHHRIEHKTKWQNQSKMINNPAFPCVLPFLLPNLGFSPSRHSSSSPPTKKGLASKSRPSSHHIASTCRRAAWAALSDLSSVYLPCCPPRLLRNYLRRQRLLAFSHHAAARMLGRRNTMPCCPVCPSRPTDGTEKFACHQTDTNKLTLVVGVTPPCGKPLICCCSAQTR